jgi:hypothetical protein
MGVAYVLKSQEMEQNGSVLTERLVYWLEDPETQKQLLYNLVPSQKFRAFDDPKNAEIIAAGVMLIEDVKSCKQRTKNEIATAMAMQLALELESVKPKRRFAVAKAKAKPHLSSSGFFEWSDMSKVSLSTKALYSEYKDYDPEESASEVERDNDDSDFEG